MKKITLSFLLLLFSLLTVNAQGIFDDSIHTATNFGSVNSPGAEGVQNIIDQNSNTKFLDFNAFDGIGFEVDLLGVSQTAIAMEIVTANDAPERDPTNFEISGSNDGTNYTSVATGSIPCISTRFFARTFSFTNTNGYSNYRVNFTGTCGTSSINQIADVQLYTAIGDTPVITCPSDITINNTTGQCTGTTTYAVTANDTEDGTITPTLITGLASGSDFPIGTTIVSYSVTDSDNNTVSCSFNVTVNDAENPVATCPANIMVDTNPGETTAIVNYTVSASDNCSTINPITGFTSLGTINGKAYYISNTTFTANNAYTDAESQGGFVGTIRNSTDTTYLLNAMNMSGISENILIGFNDIDVEGNFVWHSGATANYENWNPGEPNNAGNEDYTTLEPSGGWNDVNETIAFKYLLELDYIPQQTAGLASGSDFPIGTTTNTFIVTDVQGNSVSCSFDVIVNDTLGVDDFTLQNSIKIYPNPALTILNINNSSNITLDSISIIDVNGKIVNIINGVNNNTTISIDGLANGFYFAKIKATNGNTTVKRFIKQ